MRASDDYRSGISARCCVEERVDLCVSIAQLAFLLSQLAGVASSLSEKYQESTTYKSTDSCKLLILQECKISLRQAASGVISFVIAAVITFFTLFYLFRDGRALWRRLAALIPRQIHQRLLRVQ